MPVFQGSPVKDSPKEIKIKRKKPIIRRRHKFTPDDLHRLEKSFEQNPYPDITTREKLSKALHCYLPVIERSAVLLRKAGPESDMASNSGPEEQPEEGVAQEERDSQPCPMACQPESQDSNAERDMASHSRPEEQPEEGVAQEESDSQPCPMACQPQSQDSNTGSPVKDSPKEINIKKNKGIKRPRHKFTPDDLHILEKSFEENPYPDFTTREILSKELHCYLPVIENWFQSKRARLPLRERRRIFAIWKMDGYPIESVPLRSPQESQVEHPNHNIEQASGPAQEVLLGRAGCSCLGMQQIPTEQNGSGDSSPIYETML
nr:retinal homeobox protein Rx-like isoform X2 [Microcebus murinus]